MYELELEYRDGEVYTVEFDFSKGSYGTYEDPPEPHDIYDFRVWDYDGEQVFDVQIMDYLEDEVYDRINDGYFD